MSPAEFEPAIPASERRQTHALDRATTGIGLKTTYSAVILLSILLPAFQVQVPKWTGDSGSNPERAHGDKFV